MQSQSIEPKSVLTSFLKRSNFRILSESEAKEKARKAEENASAEQADRILAKSGIPLRHQAPIVAQGNGWLKVETRLKARLGSGFIIALCGGRGTGKTLLAANLARFSAGLGKSVLYKTAMEFFLDVKETYDSSGKRSEKQVIANYCAPKLLVIDEVQERGNSAWEDRLLTHLIDRRYQAMLDTLLIANSTPDAFLKGIGDSVGSRIVETGGVAKCDWPSFREKRD
jgi:chromosomal replication initiation ATPase DnaA